MPLPIDERPSASLRATDERPSASLGAADERPSASLRATDDILERLLHTDSVEDVAAIVLDGVLAMLRPIFSSGSGGDVLRAMVHLRPDGGYRGLLVMHPDGMVCPPREDSPWPSATTWRLVEEQRLPVLIDVRRAEVTPLGGAPLLLTDGAVSDDAFQSRTSLLARDAMYLIGLPLRVQARSLVGLISIEINAPPDTGQELFAKSGATLQRLADLVAPHLLLRPLPAVEQISGDELLPVIGAAMAATVKLLSVFARQAETILISGPTGSGKSRLARWCHARSARGSGPFEVVDLQTVPRDMQMAELFGWRKGAFTGALRDHVGSVGRADQGTLFLDEVDKLSFDAQAGLLHLLEERRYRPLGDATGLRTADVRFIVGTNADLRALVRDGAFREDLYYRINVLPVHVPHLSQRIDEIPRWAAYFLERRHREGGQTGRLALGGDAGLLLSQSPWPGNLRQLDNVIRRAYAIALAEADGELPAGGELLRRHVEAALASETVGGKATRLSDTLRQAARAYALEAERRRARDETLSMALAEEFQGLVLSSALTMTGSLKAAFRLFGLQHMVESRNHYKAFERAARRTLDAMAAAAEPADSELQAQLRRRL